MGQEKKLSIYAAPLPFSNKQVKVEVPFGSTVHEIVALVIPEKINVDDIGAVVIINDHVILRKHWKSVRPKEGTIINVRVVPKKGGGKNPLTMLLSVAIMIAAPYAGAALASAGVVSGFWMGSLFFPGALIGRAIVSAVGFLLVNALSAPPKQRPVNNPTESPTQFIEGASNQLNAWGVVPVNLGTNRMMPPKGARGYVETSGGEQYARDLFTWGWGEKIILSDLKIGETPIEEFDEVEIEHRLNGDLHLGTNIYADDPSQEDFFVVLREDGGFVTRTTVIDADEAVIDVTAFQGLVKFNGAGQRGSYKVQLEMQYALAGVSPQVWSSSAVTFTYYPGDASLVFGEVDVTKTKRNIGGTNYFVGYRKDIVIIDAYNGAVSILQGLQVSSTTNPKAPLLPSGTVKLATALVLTKKPSDTVGSSVTTVESFSDDRQSDLFTDNGYKGFFFISAVDFTPSHVGLAVTVTDGYIMADQLNITGAQAEALRRSIRIKFPVRGQYDIRIRRVTHDKESLGLSDVLEGRIFDEFTLTAIKSFTYRPVVNLVGVNGTAMRMKGTDQLNGPVNTFNGIASLWLLDYDLASDTWIERITSNPASLYRFVLQSPANAKRLADAKINLADLAEWHTHCVENGYTYNRIIDFEVSVDDVLRDIASSGAASPAVVDGKRTVVIDRAKDDIVQMITPRNSWQYDGDLVYPDLPHGFRIGFRNKEKGYLRDERIVYDDGYSEATATRFETIEIESCDNADMAFKHGRRHLAQLRLRRETHQFMMDVENLVALRGNRIKFVNDSALIGVGEGRIKSVQMTGGSPNLVAGVTLDDTVTIPSDAVFYLRARLPDASWLYKEIVADIGPATAFLFAEPFAMPYTSDSPAEALVSAGVLCSVVEVGEELDLIITRIDPGEDFNARITAVDYAQPGISDAQETSIPAFVSVITTPLEFVRLLPPELQGEPQTDESVMLLNSDGSYLKRAIFTLSNPNDGDISVKVQVRRTGTNAFYPANLLESTPERVILTGLDDDTYYDIHIRYKRIGSNVLSPPLQINNMLFVGASGDPTDPEDFMLTVSGDLALFEWAASPDIDHDHWIMKFSGVFEGATPGTSQLFKDNIYENKLTAPFLPGTYFLQAVDKLGNVSSDDGAATIITFDSSTIQNVVATLAEAPAFGGTFDNTQVVDGALVLVDTSLTDGYYYFGNNPLNLDAVYVAFVSASILANGTFVNNIYDIVDLFDTDDIYGSGQNDIFDEADIFAVSDIFGIDPGSWSVELQYRITMTDPDASPAGWGDWTPLVAGSVEFYAIEFRLKLTSLAVNVSPSVSSTLTVTVDMPDRIERGENLTVLGTGGSPPTGATIEFDPPFRASPAIAITLQNAAHDDKVVYTSKSAGGFSFYVYNNTSGYVTRVYDYIASGYGREST